MTKFLRCFFPTLFLLLLIGLQSALSCQAPFYMEGQAKGVRVNTCHVDTDFTATHACCDSAVCHRNSAPLRHLGSPEFANQIKDLLPLILESRQQIPQPKAPSTILQKPENSHQDRMILVISQAPSLILTLLGTTILLH